jgi:magnesium transporter
MKNPLIIPEIKDLLKKKKKSILKSFMQEHHPQEIAEYIQLLRPSEIWQLFNLVDTKLSVEIFSAFDKDVQAELAAGSMRKNIALLLQEMSHDDRADLFNYLDRNIANKLLLLLPISDRTDVIKLTSYEEDTAGGIMTTDYATLKEDDTIEKSFKKIRKMAPSRETVFYIYVTDNEGRLIGFVSLTDLILAQPSQKIYKIMKKDIMFGHTDHDREHIAELIEKYDLLAIPIVDKEEKLAGIVTYDDAIDVIREEQTEDMEKFMAISGGVEEKGYLDVPALVHFKKRAFWVVTLGLFGLLTGLIVESFQKTLETLIVLTFYMPLLSAAGGNTGSQSATVVLRAMTLHELDPGDILKVMKKEIVISFLLSLCLGGITFLRVFFLTGASSVPPSFTLLNISLVIGISLMLQVVWSTMFGAVVPILAEKVKVDPAVVSSPLLTTFVDMGGIIIYFTVAKIILGI